MNKIFLAFSFRPENDQLVRDIDRVVRSHGLILVTGEVLGGDGLTAKIQTRIRESDALIALLTREEKLEGQDAWRSTGWVSTEYMSARGRGQRAIAITEAKVKLDGAYAENEHIRLERTAPCEAFIRLSETIGLWKLESGRSLDIRLMPQAAATLASEETAICEYRLVAPSGDSTPWQTVQARRKPGGVFLMVQGVKLDHAIEVKILEGNTLRWRSIESPQWVHVELEDVK